SAAFQRTLRPAPLRAARRPEMRGGVLSTRKTSLSSCVVSACSGGFDGKSDAVMRKRYSPSGKAVESQLRYFSRTLSLSSFQAVSLTPRMWTLYVRVSPFSSAAFQRAPREPLAQDMAGVVVVSVAPAAAGRTLRPSAGKV